MTTFPTLFVVQGAYQTSGFYAEFESKLRGAGYQVVHPTLPTCSNTSNEDFPHRTVSDDVAVLRTQLEDLLKREETIVVIMHSYGGVLGCEAVTAEMAISTREKSGLKGGVTHLIFFGSLALPEGLSAVKANEGHCPPNSDNKPDGRSFYRHTRDHFFHDLSKDQQDIWMAKIIPHPARVLEYEFSNCAWRFIPSTCLITKRDKAITPEVQVMTAEMIGAHMEYMDACHEVHLSNPDLLVNGITSTLQRIRIVD